MGSHFKNAAGFPVGSTGALCGGGGLWTGDRSGKAPEPKILPAGEPRHVNHYHAKSEYFKQL